MEFLCILIAVFIFYLFRRNLLNRKYTVNFQQIFNKIGTNFNKIEAFLSNPKIQKLFYISVVLIVLSVCVINIMRIYDNSLWYDEIKTVKISKMPFDLMIKEIIVQGHSPLHYILAWIGNGIFNLSQDYHNFYVYHIFSFVPWFITILLGLSVVRKWFGKIVSIIFSICATLLYSSIYIALEVRMYSLCQLFILLTFLAAYKCYQNKKKISFFLLAIFSVLAIYSHYFAIPPIVGIYLIMLGYFYIKDNKYVKSVILSGLFIIASLIPWFWLSVQRQKGLISNYGLKETADLITCLNYIFSSKFSLILFIIFVIAGFASINHHFNFINLTQLNSKIKIEINYKKVNSNNVQVIWILSGLLSVFGMIIAAIVFSYLCFPIITKETLRYFLPGIVILWLLFGIFVQELRKKNLVATIVLFLIIFSGLPKLIDTYNMEIKSNIVHLQTLESVKQILKSDYCIIAYHKHFTYNTLWDVYYSMPKIKTVYINQKELQELQLNNKSLIILKNPIEKNLKNSILKRGFTLKTIKENGKVGNRLANIYLLIKH